MEYKEEQIFMFVPFLFVRCTCSFSYQPLLKSGNITEIPVKDCAQKRKYYVPLPP